MDNPLRVKCCLEQHDYLEFCCLNQYCNENRVYCFQCLKSGCHDSHMKDQRKLVDFFHNIDLESENLISKLCQMVEEIKDLMFQLNQGLRKKYQFSKEILKQLNAEQLNTAFNQIIKI